MIKSKLAIAVSLALAAVADCAIAATPTTWTTNIDAASYGSSGTITFNDWGYTGPTGVGANDFQVGAGFDSSRVGQVQKVTTLNPDWQTPDPAQTIVKDMLPPSFSTIPSATLTNASMDATVNFYAWAYTTVGGSTFNNMQIDTAGNYHVARNDMNFMFYDTFMYHDVTGAVADRTRDTVINFQPYAISDAMGWCGSVLASAPDALQKMAGQVTFDFAFDAYLNDGTPVAGVTGTPQVVPDFVMRSYGSYSVDMTVGEDVLHYEGSAVVNNTNPTTGEVDPAWQNRVSFLGAGVVPRGVWLSADSYNPDGTRKLTTEISVAATDAIYTSSLCDPLVDSVRGDGARCYQNSFAGYPFLMRADGSRQIIFVNPAGWSDYVTVPVPAAVWLLGSGLAGLAGFARRRKSVQ